MTRRTPFSPRFTSWRRKATQNWLGHDHDRVQRLLRAPAGLKQAREVGAGLTGGGS
jgi:hypothetical protein